MSISGLSFNSSSLAANAGSFAMASGAGSFGGQGGSIASAVGGELKGLQKIIDQNIKWSFSIFA